MRRILVIGLLVAACGGTQPSTALDGAVFVGWIESAEFHDEYTVTTGSIPFSIGPASLTLSTGRVLEVPADTPATMTCIELMRDEDWAWLTGWDEPTGEQKRYETAYRPCAVIGGADDDGTVSWMLVLDVTEDGEYADLNAGAVSWEDGHVTVRLRRGDWPAPVAIPLADDATNVYPTDDTCPSTVPELLDSDFDDQHSLIVDPTTGSVVGYYCQYRV